MGKGGQLKWEETSSKLLKIMNVITIEEEVFRTTTTFVSNCSNLEKFADDKKRKKLKKTKWKKSEKKKSST